MYYYRVQEVTEKLSTRQTSQNPTKEQIYFWQNLVQSRNLHQSLLDNIIKLIDVQLCRICLASDTL